MKLWPWSKFEQYENELDIAAADMGDLNRTIDEMEDACLTLMEANQHFAHQLDMIRASYGAFLNEQDTAKPETLN